MTGVECAEEDIFFLCPHTKEYLPTVVDTMLRKQRRQHLTHPLQLVEVEHHTLRLTCGAGSEADGGKSPPYGPRGGFYSIGGNRRGIRSPLGK